MRILLADDHDLVREAISLLFQQYFDDCEVAEAGALEPALDLIDENNSFDLVLLDLRMPGMNGLEGLKRALEKVAPSTFVVLLSGAYRSEDVRNAIEAGTTWFHSQNPARAGPGKCRSACSGRGKIPAIVDSE